MITLKDFSENGVRCFLQKHHSCAVKLKFFSTYPRKCAKIIDKCKLSELGITLGS